MYIPSWVKRIIWVAILIIGLPVCTRVPGQDIADTSTPGPTTAPTTAAVTSNSTASPSPTSDEIPSIPQQCRLGLGLRSETIDILLNHKDQVGFVMSANLMLAEQYFSHFEDSFRVIGAPSLEEMKEKGERAKMDAIPYEALGYGLETSSTTPDKEWQDLVGSTTTAKALADDLHKILVMGPGFKLMAGNEDMYAPMAASTDIWLLQTQQLQKDPPGDPYRAEVERIVELIRSGNPDIKIWAQITLPPDRVPDAVEWLAYRAEIADLVDGTYIGVYTWDKVDQDQLVSTIEKIFETACVRQ